GAGTLFEGLAWRLLQMQGSLSRLSPTRVRIVPKTHFSGRGITMRSLSRYLALCYESVDVRWRCADAAPAEQSAYNLLLVPWPLEVPAGDFRPAPPSLLENMDRDLFGFFEFAPEQSLDCDFVRSLVETAIDRVGTVDAVVFPEAAIRAEVIADLERTLELHGITFLIARASHPPRGTAPAGNSHHLGPRPGSGGKGYEREKPPRGCLDESQIRQYHLTRSLDPRMLWWEAIDIRERTLHVIDLGGGLTTAPLVCEDL